MMHTWVWICSATLVYQGNALGRIGDSKAAILTWASVVNRFGDRENRQLQVVGLVAG